MKTNQNKENKRVTNQSLSLFMTQPPKRKTKSPLRDRQNLANSIQASPTHQWNSKSKMISSQNYYSNFLTNLEKSDFSASIKDKFRVMHISSVHGLINSARQKKSEIEDLLRQEQFKAEYNDLDEADLSTSLRKLKKVVRLLEIVCKIILGKNEQNCYIDIHSQLQASIKGMHVQSVENYEHEIQTKNCQISRLKKLIQILSCPQNQRTVNDDNESQLIRSSFIENLVYQAETQTEKTSLEESIFDKSKELVESLKLIKSNKFSICQSFSLWNICDAFQRQQSQIKNTVELSSHQKSLRVLSICRLPLVSVQEKSTFLKRYKSIVKICLNSLNICNNLFIKQKGTQQQKIIEQKIAEVSNFFNSQYHRNASKYNEHFCKEIRDRIEQLYDELHSQYKNSKKSILMETCSF